MVFVVVLLISEFFHILHHDKIVCLYNLPSDRLIPETMPCLVRLLRVTVNHV